MNNKKLFLDRYIQEIQLSNYESSLRMYNYHKQTVASLLTADTTSMDEEKFSLHVKRVLTEIRSLCMFDGEKGAVRYMSLIDSNPMLNCTDSTSAEFERLYSFYRSLCCIYRTAPAFITEQSVAGIIESHEWEWLMTDGHDPEIISSANPDKHPSLINAAEIFWLLSLSNASFIPLCYSADVKENPGRKMYNMGIYSTADVIDTDTYQCILNCSTLNATMSDRKKEMLDAFVKGYVTTCKCMRLSCIDASMSLTPAHLYYIMCHSKAADTEYIERSLTADRNAREGENTEGNKEMQQIYETYFKDAACRFMQKMNDVVKNRFMTDVNRAITEFIKECGIPMEVVGKSGKTYEIAATATTSADKTFLITIDDIQETIEDKR